MLSFFPRGVLDEILNLIESVSEGFPSYSLNNRLGMPMLTARWIPKSFSNEQMAIRASVCSVLLKRFRSKDDFLLRLVTVDET